MNYSSIEQRLSQNSLRCCGGFHPTSEDQNDTAILADFQTAIIVGNAGNRTSFNFWQAFENAKEEDKNPLESWTRQTLTKIAGDLDAAVIFPFDGPPYIPILTWAQKAEPVYPSPFGPLIHQKFGLWHAYRGVLLFKDKLDLPSFEIPASPCVDCAGQSCISTCPVNAIEAGNFDIEVCIEFMASAKGNVCLQNGCLARRACPIGQEHVYEPAQAEFHLTAFLKTFGPKFT
jgi:ferredoxin